MGSGFQFFDIIVFAAIAAFLVLRLRSVLGKRSGRDREAKHDPFKIRSGDEAPEEKVISLPDRDPSQSDAPGDPEPSLDPSSLGDASPAAALNQIKLADRSFDVDIFVSGAKAAFEMVINAFAQGDTRSLRPLLSNDVYEDFSSAIKNREEANEQLETTLVGIGDAEIIQAELQGKTAFVTVKFVSEQINVTRDAAGEIVDGDADHVAANTDLWTFARNTRSRDPNWTLVATSSTN